MDLRALTTLAEHTIAWERWEETILRNGITVDRPRGSRHPQHPSIVYPIDYGYVNRTLATDGHELDVFRGTAAIGLVGTMITLDHRKGDCEFKLIHDCSPDEIYLINGFINFDPYLMEGVLVLRRPMDEIREMAGG